MSRVTQFFKRLIGARSEEQHSPESIQELRAAFKARYQSFRLLLTANNKALEIMTELERALEGHRPFGMSFVRAKCTAVCVNVYRIVKYLDELGPGKYKDLYDRFRIIQEHVNESLVQKTETKADKLIVPLSSVHKGMVDLVGGKMLNVAQLKNELGLQVPNGFVITSAAYGKLLAHNDLAVEIDRRVQSAESQGIDGLLSLSAGIQQLIIDAAVPAELEQAVTEAYKELERHTRPDIPVSLRSSALGEDVAGRAFAGQFRSELNVSAENLLHAYKEVVASKYSLPAMTYRLSRGIPEEEVAMCVGCMAMVDAVAGGVMYSRNPVDIRDRAVLINSVWGLPKAVVDGSVEPDLFIITREAPTAVLRKEIKQKQRQFVCYPEEGVCRLDLVGEKAWAQSITDEQAVELASMAMRLDDYYGSAQDIEWAITAEGSVYLLQCRPLQQWSSRKRESGRVQRKAESAALAAEGGKTASPGVGCGPVFVVRTDADKLRFPESAVLVTAQALPRWAPLLSRAAALVTEMGGVTGHLGNVAREFGVPALFGVPGATEKLEEGSLVTIDADGLAIYRGRVESLLVTEPTRRNLMEGSPIHQALKRAAGHIIPLNLLDPDAPEFHPKKCRTLHDITRFAHEKSVHEMFSFGRDHHFSERSSKQLVCDVPMQWWVINLEDGFDHDVDGKFVHLDNIVSVPMLALWKGITAIPWEGPPPVDTRGFMSVLVQATANPALDPAMDSPYAVRNYFMISRHFCSLTSRFGFHFSTVEALVGDRSVENYISFNFKGGAADLRRKSNRAALVGSIVEEVGFRIEVREDSLGARLEGRDEEFMKNRLMILGYLTIHTRQLDMVLADKNLINAYRQRLLGQIKTFAS